MALNLCIGSQEISRKPTYQSDVVFWAEQDEHGLQVLLEIPCRQEGKVNAQK